MNKCTQSECGYIVYEDGGTNLLTYGASEDWFPTYDEAIKYAMDVVKKRTEEFKKVYDCNSVIVYEGPKSLMNEPHGSPCGRVVFNWMNYYTPKD